MTVLFVLLGWVIGQVLWSLLIRPALDSIFYPSPTQPVPTRPNNRKDT